MKRRIGAALLLVALLAAGVCLPAAYLDWSMEALMGESVSISRTSVSPYGGNGLSRDRIRRLCELMNWENLFVNDEPDTLTAREPITGELSNAEALVACEPFLEAVDTAIAESFGLEGSGWTVYEGDLCAGQEDNQLSFYVLQFVGTMSGEEVYCTIALDAVSGIPVMLGVDLGPVDIGEDWLLDAVVKQYEKQFNLSFNGRGVLSESYSVTYDNQSELTEQEDAIEYIGDIYPLTGEIYTAKSEDYQLYCEAFVAGTRILYLIHLEC